MIHKKILNLLFKTTLYKINMPLSFIQYRLHLGCMKDNATEVSPVISLFSKMVIMALAH